MSIASRIRTFVFGEPQQEPNQEPIQEPAHDALQEEITECKDSVNEPILISDDIGTFPDEMDKLDATDDVYRMPEDLSLLQKLLQELADSDPQFAASMPKYWLCAVPSEAFADFLDCGIPDAVIRLLSKFGFDKHHYICDLGCGTGHLVYALARRGFEHLAAMDPVADYTGYIESSTPQIELIKSIETWRTIGARFDAIVSNGTIHHWHHIPLISRDARKTLKPGGYWFAIQEAYANTPHDLAFQMHNHPTASRFNHYEWFYPASAYVDLVQSVGFSLVGVVPFGYRQNELLMPSKDVTSDSESEEVDRDLSATVEMFWREVDALRRNKATPQRFTIPQALVFRRVAI